MSLVTRGNWVIQAKFVVGDVTRRVFSTSEEASIEANGIIAGGRVSGLHFLRYTRSSDTPSEKCV